MSLKSETPEAARWWLAGLEKPCSDCKGSGSEPTGTEYGGQSELVACSICGGSGMVPVLPTLRNIHPDCLLLNQNIVDSAKFCDQLFKKVYGDCKGIGWLPKQGRDILHEALNKAGFDVIVIQLANGQRRVDVVGDQGRWNDTDDYIAAAKAMRNAGYGGGDAL